MPLTGCRTVLALAGCLIAFAPAACSSDSVDRAASSDLSADKLDAAQRGLIKLIAETPEDESDEQSSRVPCPLGNGAVVLSKAHLPTTVTKTYTASIKTLNAVGCSFEERKGSEILVIAARQNETYLQSRKLTLQQPYLGGRLYTREQAPDPRASPNSGDDTAHCSAAWVKPGRRFTISLSIDNVAGVSETGCGPALQDALPYLVDRFAVAGN